MFKLLCFLLSWNKLSVFISNALQRTDLNYTYSDLTLDYNSIVNYLTGIAHDIVTVMSIVWTTTDYIQIHLNLFLNINLLVQPIGYNIIYNYSKSSIKDGLAKNDFLDPPLSDIVRLEDPPILGRSARIARKHV